MIRATGSWRVVLVLLGWWALLQACAEPPLEPSTSEVPQRIVALAPNVTEILFALDLGDRVVGVGDYSAWPPEVEALPRLGGLYDVSLERILELDPDLAILIPSEAELATQLRRLGIEVLAVENESLEEVEISIGQIARRCGVEERGEALVEGWSERLEPRATGQGRRVFLSVVRSPGGLRGVLTAGPGTFYDELLQRLGAVNVFADATALYLEVGPEEIVARAPELIIELQTEELVPEQEAALLADWQALPGLPAVAGGCVSILDGSHTALPGPRLPLLYNQLELVLSECAPGAARP